MSENTYDGFLKPITIKEELIKKWLKDAEKLKKKNEDSTNGYLDRIEYGAKANQLLDCALQLKELIELYEED